MTTSSKDKELQFWSSRSTAAKMQAWPYIVSCGGRLNNVIVRMSTCHIHVVTFSDLYTVIVLILSMIY